jgi:hypothetical protein
LRTPQYRQKSENATEVANELGGMADMWRHPRIRKGELTHE